MSLMYYVLIRFKTNLRSNICKLNLIALKLNLLHSFYELRIIEKMKKHMYINLIIKYSNYACEINRSIKRENNDVSYKKLSLLISIYHEMHQDV